MSNTDNNKTLDPDDREWQVVPVSYKTPTILLI